MSKYDVVIIGAGPGGYVAAIRSAQLGMKVALVERESVGGVCLNWGCIPSKSLLKNAEVLSLMKHADKFGITFSNLEYDLSKAMARSRQVSERLVKGVQFLLKKNKVDLVKGEAKIVGNGKIEVAPEGQKLEAKNIIIATGSRPRIIPGLEFDSEVIISSYDALKLTEVPPQLANLTPVRPPTLFLQRRPGAARRPERSIAPDGARRKMRRTLRSRCQTM